MINTLKFNQLEYKDGEAIEFDPTLFQKFRTQGGFLNNPYDWFYVNYLGSDPAPPCDHGQVWNVSIMPLSVSSSQLEVIDSMFKIKPSRALQETRKRILNLGEMVTGTLMNTVSGDKNHVSAVKPLAAWTNQYTYKHVPTEDEILMEEA